MTVVFFKTTLVDSSIQISAELEGKWRGEVGAIFPALRFRLLFA